MERRGEETKEIALWNDDGSLEAAWSAGRAATLTRSETASDDTCLSDQTRDNEDDLETDAGKAVPGLDTAGGLEVIVHKGEASGATTTEGSLEVVDRDLVDVLDVLGEHLLDTLANLRLGDGAAVGVHDLDGHLAALKKAVVHKVTNINLDGVRLGLLLVNRHHGSNNLDSFLCRV